MRSSAHAHASASDSSQSSSSALKKEKELALKKRNRRKTVRAKRGEERVETKKLVHPRMPEVVLSSAPLAEDDHVRHLDTHLVKGAYNRANRVKPKRVQVHFEPHEPSAHIIRLQGMARKISSRTREPKARSIHSWVAPSDTPPSLARMAAEALDLYVDQIDPRELYTQFTPFDPEAAYRERRGLWERIRAPFIRWELTWHPVEEVQITESEELIPEEEPFVSTGITEAEVMVPPRILDEVQDVAIASSKELEEHYAESTPIAPTSVKKQAWHDRLSDWLEMIGDRARSQELEIKEDAEQVLGVPMLVPKVHIVRVLAGFVGLLCVVSLPAGAVSLSRSFSSTVEKTMTASRNAAQEAQGAMVGGVIQKDVLSQASAQFAQANDELTHANGLATAIVQALPKTREVYRAGRLLLEAGEKGTRAAEIIAEGFNRASEQSVSHPDERLLAIQTHLQAAAPLITEATQAVAAVDIQALPANTRAQVLTLRDSLSQGEVALQEAQLLTTLGIAALGHDRPRTYLFIFQNQAELRPTGGFMGSIAEVTFDRGEIRSMHVPGGGPYDLRNQLKSRVRPPGPLQLVSSRWEFQDANWFPDFPTAAQKINWFWSQAGQPTLDGIVTINATVLRDLLHITGPITLSEYGKTFDADNVLLELQKSVELEYDKTENKPKKIIGDLLPEILNRLRGADQDQLLSLIKLFGSSLQTKDIQLWLRNVDEQTIIANEGWSGTFPEVIGDTLAVNEANIGGQKTDAVISEQVDHDIEIQADGAVIDTVTLWRKHTGEKGELFHGANNVAFVRLYAPLGSELLSASGFQPPPATSYKQVLPEDPLDSDISALELQKLIDPSGVRVTEEFGRTAFGGWVQLGPGASSKTVFRYRLPMNAFDLRNTLALKGTDLSTPVTNEQSVSRAAYLLSLVSQSGKTDRGLTVRIHIPEGWKLAWSSQNLQVQDRVLTLSSANWDRDRVLGVLFDLPHDQTP